MVADKSSHKMYQVQAEITLEKENPAIKITNIKHPETKWFKQWMEKAFHANWRKDSPRTAEGNERTKKEMQAALNLVFSFFKLIFFPSGFNHSFTNTHRKHWLEHAGQPTNGQTKQGGHAHSAALQCGFAIPTLTRGWSKVREGSYPTSVGLSLENEAWPCRNCYNFLILWCHMVSKYIPINAKGKRCNLWNVHTRKLLWERDRISTQQRAEPSFCFSIFDEKSFCLKALHLPRPSIKGCKVWWLTRLKQLITAQRVREGCTESGVILRSTQTQGN